MDSERIHFKKAAADVIFTFLLLLLFANRYFQIGSSLRMVSSDAHLSLSSFFTSPPTEQVRQPVFKAICPSPCMYHMDCC